MSTSPPSVVEQFRRQAGWCEALGSPLSAALCRASAEALGSPGPIADVLAPFVVDAAADALPLRVLGALHRLALAGEAPALAAHYPSCGGDGDAGAAVAALERTTAHLAARLGALIGRHPQTNEVSRSAALLGGYLTIAAETRRPLRVLEIGASAGLNLLFDRFRYVCGEWAWGDVNSPVVLDRHFAEPPPFEASARCDVVERRGCDLDPIDPATDDGRLTLRSFVWADQLERLALLDAAIDVATRVAAPVDRSRALPWLEDALRTPRPGVATVVVHTVVLQYLPEPERDAVEALLERAGSLATAEAPLAHLFLEPWTRAAVCLRTWPGGEFRALAASSPHGREVRWIARGG